MSCDPDSAFTGCTYQYPINAIGLSDTIKTTDTIWIDNDLDARLCWGGIYKNGEGEEIPNFYKLENDSFIYSSSVKIVGFSDSSRNQDNLLLYQIKIKYINERYRSKYGIIFPEPGIYYLGNFGCAIANGIDNSISIQGYFNVSSNNQNLFSDKVITPDSKIDTDKYGVYYLRVIK
jgi:hypothetical protein